MASIAENSAAKPTQKEIYDYLAPHPVYGLGWSARTDKPFRLAVGSFIEEYTNKVEIIQLKKTEADEIPERWLKYPSTV